jgi:cytoskeletal protein CcmA (bactofilin family)
MNRSVKPAAQEEPRRSVGHSTIGRGLEIEGEIRGKDELTVEGKVIGKINVDNAVTIGQTGDVNAEILAEIVTVMGKVKGDITARGKVILKPTSVVVGNITCPSFVVNDGAAFDGNISMESKSHGAGPGRVLAKAPETTPPPVAEDKKNNRPK